MEDALRPYINIELSLHLTWPPSILSNTTKRQRVAPNSEKLTLLAGPARAADKKKARTDKSVLAYKPFECRALA